MIERTVDFERLRYMRCGTCSHEWEVDTEWLDRFDTGDEPCPECGTDCTSENCPNFWVRPQDPVHDDSTVRDLYWYHSSTHAVWPDRDFDPTAQLTDDTKKMMEHDGLFPGAVERWAARQRSKALHVGTYEAAIENMLRRMTDQSDAGSQFYLHRVQLRTDCVIEPGIHREPTDFVGDAQLAGKCGPGVNALRYVNVHEDPSNVSLAIEIDAVWRVQTIPIPLAVDADDSELSAATERLLAEAGKPAVEEPPEDGDDQIEQLFRRHRVPVTPLAAEAGALREEVADRLPSMRRARFNVEFDEAGYAAAPSAFPAKLIGLARLIDNPRAVIDALAEQPWRYV
ncbi:hypothetical protein MUG78_17975 [Gordonia alkaliphila]|uniref:hypothetical protein n=1 Tax=Gordonia alkaliphila TaxID=1053547 RepID=UPI001FF49237|nr:hypothetical protein [Gordonia alkaliphila]MCK0441291.1 hypothetical protein [Gordonia alkaliphila]